MRPAITFPGTKARYEGIDLITVRENTEGAYGSEGQTMYWHNRGLFVLGRQVCTEALARPGADRSISKARALLSLGVVQRLSGRVPDAIEPLKEALTIAGEHDERRRS